MYYTIFFPFLTQPKGGTGIISPGGSGSSGGSGSEGRSEGNLSGFHIETTPVF
jgi:hypothetical protein